MSTAEIIEQIAALKPHEREAVLRHFFQEHVEQDRLYDEFTLLGKDTQGTDVSYAAAAQAEVLRDEHS